jgi:hypothetical protein
MDQFEEEAIGATIRANERMARDPRAIAARYEDGHIVIDLSTRYRVSFAPERAQGLAGAAPSDLAEIEITPSGYGLHWPKLNADLWLPALLEGVFGSRAWMAARLGAEGGKATSDAKVAAARENGKRGGRPKRRMARKQFAKRQKRPAKRKPAARASGSAKRKQKAATALMLARRRKTSAKRQPAPRKRA